MRFLLRGCQERQPFSHSEEIFHAEFLKGVPQECITLLRHTFQLTAVFS